MKSQTQILLLLMISLGMAVPSVGRAGDGAKGQGTYAAKCQVCHGEKGDGNGPAGKSLTPHPANFTDAKFMALKTDDHLTKVIKDGGAAVGKSPIMSAFGGQLTDGEVADLVAYIRTFAQK